MGSYLPLKIGNTLYPVKVGGYTGKDEPKVALTQKQLAKIKRAVKNDDKVVLRELEQVVDKTAVQDIRTAYMAWIPREVVKAEGLTTDIKKVTFVLPSKTVIVPVRTASKWLTTKTKGRAKPITIWFGDPGSEEKLQPFTSLMNAQLRAGLYEGLKLLDTFTLSRKPKKIGSVTYYRKPRKASNKASAAMVREIIKGKEPPNEASPSEEIDRRRKFFTKEFFGTAPYSTTKNFIWNENDPKILLEIAESNVYLDPKDRAELKRKLRIQGYLLVKANEARSKKNKGWIVANISRHSKGLLAGTFSTKKEAMASKKQMTQGYDDPEIKVMTFSAFSKLPLDDLFANKAKKLTNAMIKKIRADLETRGYMETVTQYGTEAVDYALHNPPQEPCPKCGAKSWVMTTYGPVCSKCEYLDLGKENEARSMSSADVEVMKFLLEHGTPEAIKVHGKERIDKIDKTPVHFKKMWYGEKGGVEEKYWKSTIGEFRESYPEYTLHLMETGSAGDAIGQGLWFQAHVGGNASLAPEKGTKRVTRELAPREATVLGRSGEINLPFPERRTGRKKAPAKRRISSATRQITTRIEKHPGKSKTGEKTDVKAHPRRTGKAKKFKHI